MRQPLSTSDAPAAIGPYAQAIQVGSWIYTSGQIPLRPGETTISLLHFEEQAHQVLKNLQAVLQSAGAELRHIVKWTIFLTCLDHFPALNTLMEAYLSPPYPARSTVEVSALPKGALIEIEAVAYLE